MRKAYGILVALLAAVVVAPATQAGELAVGVTTEAFPKVVGFDTAAPGTIRFQSPISGLGFGERLVGIDARVGTGQIFAVSNFARMFVLDPASGAATLVATTGGATFPLGFDFNPTVDRLRFVHDTNVNYRWNPVTLVGVDTDAGTPGIQGDTNVAFISTDPNFGNDPAIVGAAYTNNDTDGATPTTLYDLDAGIDGLVRQGAVDGNAGDVAGGASPNGGLLTTIGPLGVAFTDAAFDIARGPSPGGNVAYAALRSTGFANSRLATVNLGTGAATLVGTIPVAPLDGMTILPGGALAASPVRVAEGAGSAVVQVSRLGDTLAPVDVGYRAVARTAAATADFTAVSGALSFAQDERTKTVTIPVVSDKTAEPTETLALELSSAAGGAVIETPATLVEIVDDDDAVKPAVLAAPTVPDTLRALRRTGSLKTEYACSEACVVSFSLRIGSKQVGSAIASRGSAGVGRATVRLSSAGKTAVRKAANARGGRVRLILRATATDPAGNATTKSTTMLVRRR